MDISLLLSASHPSTQVAASSPGQLQRIFSKPKKEHSFQSAVSSTTNPAHSINTDAPSDRTLTAVQLPANHAGAVVNVASNVIAASSAGAAATSSSRVAGGNSGGAGGGGDDEGVIATLPSFSRLASPLLDVDKTTGAVAHGRVEKRPSSSKPFECSYAGCGATFGQKGSLTRHIRSRHEKLRPYSCELCRKSFSALWTLRVHQRNVHLKSKPHKCHLCDKSFGELFNKSKHIAIVHEGKRPFACPICSRAFGYKGDMRKHVLELHQQAGRPFQCPVPSCGVKFARKRYLRRHENLSHKGHLLFAHRDQSSSSPSPQPHSQPQSQSQFQSQPQLQAVPRTLPQAQTLTLAQTQLQFQHHYQYQHFPQHQHQKQLQTTHPAPRPTDSFFLDSVALNPLARPRQEPTTHLIVSPDTLPSPVTSANSSVVLPPRRTFREQ